MAAEYIARVLGFEKSYVWKEPSLKNGTLALQGYWEHTKDATTTITNDLDPLMILPTDAAFGSDLRFRAVLTQLAADQDVFDSTFASAFGKLLAAGTSTFDFGTLVPILFFNIYFFGSVFRNIWQDQLWSLSLRCDRTVCVGPSCKRNNVVHAARCVYLSRKCF
jgi:hypothetical protein